VGVDLSGSAVERLRRQFPDGTFAQLDLTRGDEALEAAVGHQRFDLVTAIDVLYHIVDDGEFARALASLGRVVAPGGRLLVSDVFVERPTTIAAHVRRRPLSQYEESLATQDLRLLGREAVFAVLGDPVPRPGFKPTDLAMHIFWRVLSKSVRSVPEIARDDFGRIAAQLLTSLDSGLRRLGWAQGVNLELALFGCP
jgi:SAM-dependent methyltransferase